MKFPKSIFLFLITICLCSAVPIEATAATPFTYKVTITSSQGGHVYFNYGKNGRFFLNDHWKTYHPTCKAVSGVHYPFTKLLTRSLIPKPKDGYYFSGFYDTKGRKLSLTKTKVDILRVSVKGVYFYDYFVSKDQSPYHRYTTTAYQKLVKNYLKSFYGTSRYKKMDTVMLYKLPKKDLSIVAKFKNKTAPSLPIPTTIIKTFGEKDFSLFPLTADMPACKFKSSNSKILSINKHNGCCIIKSPGVVKVTTTAAETEKTHSTSYTTMVTIKPSVVKTITAKKTKVKTLSISWTANAKNSGYEIQVSNNKKFRSILAKKTVNGGRTKKTTLRLKSEVCNNYVRIRPYKTSGGKRIYSEYTLTKIRS